MISSFTIYTLVLLVACLSGIPLYNKKNITVKMQISNGTVVFLLLLLPILVLGVRYNVGTDYLSYEHAYFARDAVMDRKLEPLYRLLSNFFRYFNCPYYVLTTAIEMLCFYLSQRIVCKTKLDGKYFYFFYFVSSFLFYSLNIQRQAVACLFFLQALPFCEKKKFLHYCFWIILGAGFHTSVLFMLPFYFIYKMYEKLPKEKISIMIFIIVISFVFQTQILTILYNIIFFLINFTPYSHYGYLVRSWTIPMSRGLGVIVHVYMFLVAAFAYKGLRRQYGSFFDVVFFYSFLGTFMRIFFSTNILLFRIAFLFLPVIILLCSFSYKFFYAKGTITGYALFIGSICIFLLYFFGMIFSRNSNCAPFQFIWNK